MSTKITNSIDVEVDSTEVNKTSTKDLVTSGTHCVDTQQVASTVEGYKKEYSIVGDGLYASVSAEDAPAWLRGLIDNVVESSIQSGMLDYELLVQDVRSAIESIDVARNTYVEQINIDSIVNGIITTRLQTLNATVNNHEATIVDIDTVTATAEYVASLRASELRSEFNDTADARATHIVTTYADENLATSTDVNNLLSIFEDQENNQTATANAVTGLQTYVGLDEEGVPNNTGMLSRIEILENQNDGVVEFFTGSQNVMVNAEDTSSPEDDELILTAEPYASWVAEDTTNGDIVIRTSHIGDVYIQYDLNGSYLRSYKFIKTAEDTTVPLATDSEGFTWALVTNTDAAAAYAMALTARDLADGKRRVFTTTPTVPYDEGDLWVDSSVSPQIVKVSEHTRSVVYDVTDWVQADQQANDFINNTYPGDQTSLQNQLDGVIEYSFYNSCTDITDPETTEGAIDESRALDIIDNAWTTAAQREAANGNVVYFKDTRNAYWYQSSTPAWISITDTSIYEALQDAAEAKGAADGKVSQFYAWGGSEPPADYSIVTTPQVLDDDGVTVLQEAVSTSYSGSEFIFWYKSDGSLYYKSNDEWITVPTTPGEINYIAAGDVLTVLDPTNNDLTSYTYNGTSWQQVGPTNIISKSKFFVDLENEVLGDYGTVASSISSLETRSQAYTNDEGARVENNFAYNSNIILNGKYYKSGFGLDSSGITQEEGVDGSASNAFDSEFWVNAERFVLKSPSYPDIQASFSVTSSGIQLGVEHTEATKNVPQGTYSSSSTYGLGDIVTYNNSSYMALQTVTNVTPNNDGTNWQLLALKGDTPLVFDWSGTSNWPTSTTEANALEYSFDSSFSGTAIVRVLAYDADGGVRIKFNSADEIAFTRSLSSGTQEWYEFTFDNLAAGTNAIKFWSTTNDDGSIKAIEVAFAGAKGLDGAYTDFLFTRKESEPENPGGADTWYTSATDTNLIGSGNLWSIKKNVTAGGSVTTYTDKRVIDAPIIREITIYSNATTGTPTAPTDSTYDFSADSLSIGTNPEGFTWSRSLSGISSTGEKIYATTALVTGNATQTSVSITWGDVVVYTQRQDGVSYSGTTEYYRLTSSSTAPDRYSEGTTIHTDWTTTPSTPTSTNKYLWNFNRNSRSDGTFDDSSVSLITQYVQDGNAITGIVEKYQLSTSATVAPTDTWSDTIADAGALSKDYPYLWNQTTISYSQTTDDVITSLIAARGTDGTDADIYREVMLYTNASSSPNVPAVESGWNTSGSSVAVAATETTPAWTINASTPSVGELTWRTQITLRQPLGSGDWEAVDAAWGTPIQLTGLSGEATDTIYTVSTEAPTTPAASSTIPSGWSATLPTKVDNIWVSIGTKGQGSTTYTWGAPVMLSEHTPNMLLAQKMLPWPTGTNSAVTEGGTWIHAGDGNEDIRELGVDPFGGTSVIWTATNGDSAGNYDGGFAGSPIVEIDSSKTYRFTLFMKQDSTVAGRYFGFHSYVDETVSGPLTNSGTTSSAPLFGTSFDLPTNNEWYMLVGFLKPYGSTETTNRAETGIWRVSDGVQVDNSSFNDFRIGSADVNGVKIRAYYFGDNFSSARSTYFWGPRIDVMDDRAPTITDLLRKSVQGQTYKEIFLYANAAEAPTLPPVANYFDTTTGSSAVVENATWTPSVGSPATGESTWRTSLTLVKVSDQTLWTNHDSAWNTAIKVSGHDGVNADSYKEIFLYATTTSLPTKPPLTNSYSATTGEASSPNTTWVVDPIAATAGNKIYRSSLTLIQNESTGNWANSDAAWSAPVQLTGEEGQSIEGPRGTAVLTASVSIEVSDPGTTNTAVISAAWNSVASSEYAEEKAGDTLIVTNTLEGYGWTHIYEYTGSIWSPANAFVVNGNQVVTGTLSATAIGSGSFITTQLSTAVVPSGFNGTIMDNNGVSVYNNGVLRVRVGSL